MSEIQSALRDCFNRLVIYVEKYGHVMEPHDLQECKLVIDDVRPLVSPPKDFKIGR